MQMLILIKREIEDHIAYFIAAAILSGLLILLCISSAIRIAAHDGQGPVVEGGLAIPVIVVIVICLTAMGTSQMYNDKNQRISAFLSTLPTSRAAIMTARFIAGLLMVMLLFVPVAITGHILVSIFTPPVPIISSMFIEIAVTVFLMCLGCYCTGLLTGWTSSRLVPTLAALVLACLIIPLIIIKGFGLEADIILLLYIIASLIHTWCKFSTASL